MVFKKRIILKQLFRKYSKTTTSAWQSVVGLEVHAQINSVSKLFSGAATTYASLVNSNVSLFDCAIPGTLPVLNKRCVEAGVLTALALNCKVNPISYFDRKHYFYADLPTGYQITQQRAPLGVDGSLEFIVFNIGIHKEPYTAKVNIKQLQLEQDSGKSLHDHNRGLIDLNRAGIPLMEVVFDPDLKDGEEAAALVKELTLILKKINTCSCKMEEGAFRVDANVSINRKGEPLGVRTEVKNIGSIRGVAAAVDYEIKRQIKVKESGGTILNETRAWDAVKKITLPMRDKEVQQDYRYMPEPNLPPLFIAMGPVESGCVNADKLRKHIPELPEQTRQRLLKTYDINMLHCIFLVNDPPLLTIFEGALKIRKIGHKILINFIMNELKTCLNDKNLETTDIKSPPDYFGQIVELIERRVINRNAAKVLLEEIILGSEETPLQIVEKRNLLLIADKDKLTKICEEVIEENEKAVKDYKRGKTQALKFIITAIINKNSCVDTKKCKDILIELLNK